MKTVFDKIRGLINESRINSAFNELEKIITNSSHNDDFSILKNRHVRLNRESRMGLLSQTDENTGRTRITFGLLGLVADIEKNSTRSKLLSALKHQKFEEILDWLDEHSFQEDIVMAAFAQYHNAKNYINSGHWTLGDSNYKSAQARLRDQIITLINNIPNIEKLEFSYSDEPTTNTKIIKEIDMSIEKELLDFAKKISLNISLRQEYNQLKQIIEEYESLRTQERNEIRPDQWRELPQTKKKFNDLNFKAKAILERVKNTISSNNYTTVKTHLDNLDKFIESIYNDNVQIVLIKNILEFITTHRPTDNIAINYLTKVEQDIITDWQPVINYISEILKTINPADL